MAQQTQKLEIEHFAGIELEKGKLIRPGNSFEVLDNFLLTKDGTIQKAGGCRLLGPWGIEIEIPPNAAGPLPTAFPSPIVAFKDYRRVQSEVIKGAAVSKAGRLYDVRGFEVVAPPLKLRATDFGSLTEDQELEEAPFVTTMPSRPEETENFIYLIVTCGAVSRVKKFDGTVISNLGVDAPEANWTKPLEHSIAVRRVVLTDSDLRGTRIRDGRRYRYTWYNPTTKRDSNLAPLHTQTAFKQTSIDGGVGFGSEAILGTAFGTENNPYAEEIALTIAEDANNRVPTGDLDDIAVDPAYTHIRIWATREQGEDYLLLKNVYDITGLKITDDDGAIEAIGTGIGTGLDDGFAFYDGWVPKTDEAGTTFNFVPSYMDQDYEDSIQPVTVDGGGQSGNELLIDVSTAPPPFYALINIGDDKTLYRVTNREFIGASQWKYTLDQDLVVTPDDDAPIVFVRIKPTADADLVERARPEGFFNSPPPFASWGAVFQNQLFLVDAINKNRIVYSDPGDFESFHPDNEILFLSDNVDPITAVLTGRQTGSVSEGVDARLVVAKSRSSSKLTGSTKLDFVKTDLYPETGVVHKRAAVVVNGILLGFTRQGLEFLEGQVPVFIGDKIRDILRPSVIETQFGPVMATDRRLGQVLFGINSGLRNAPTMELRSTTNDLVILMHGRIRQSQDGLESPFSTYSSLPTGIFTLTESGESDNIHIIASGEDGYLYELLTGGMRENNVLVVNDTYTPFIEPVQAQAITQYLPQEDKATRKIFRKLWLEGNEVDLDPGWKVVFEVDGVTYGSYKKLYRENFIGLNGKQIRVKFLHDRAVGDGETQPFLANMWLEFIEIGVSR